MNARGLTEQELPGELLAEAQPVADDPPPVAAPTEPEPDSIDAWRALVAKLQARIAEIESPPDRLLTLKNAAYAERVDSENLRRWYWSGKVTGEKRHGNIFISQRSLKEYLKPRQDRG